MMSDFDKNVELLNKIQKVIEKHGLVKTYEHAADDEGKTLFGTYTFPDALECGDGDVMKVEMARFKSKDGNIKEKLNVYFACGCWASNFDVCHKVKVQFSMWRDIEIDENFEEICDDLINKLRRDFEKELSIATENSKIYHIKQIKKAGGDYVC